MFRNPRLILEYKFEVIYILNMALPLSLSDVAAIEAVGLSNDLLTVT
jgi:hypothetical protein